MQWAYESEVRLIFETSTLKEHHESAITGIYFGYKSDDALIDRFKEIFKNRDVVFYRAKPNIRKNILEFDVIEKFSRSLIYNLDEFEFELIYTKNSLLVKNYFIYIKKEYTEEKLMELSNAFLEKYSYKPSNLFYLNSKSKRILRLIDIYPKSDKEYVDWAEALVAELIFECKDQIWLYPLKDWRYKEIKKRFRSNII